MSLENEVSGGDQPMMAKYIDEFSIVRKDEAKVYRTIQKMDDH